MKLHSFVVAHCSAPVPAAGASRPSVGNSRDSWEREGAGGTGVRVSLWLRSTDGRISSTVKDLLSALRVSALCSGSEKESEERGRACRCPRWRNMGVWVGVSGGRGGSGAIGSLDAVMNVTDTVALLCACVRPRRMQPLARLQTSCSESQSNQFFYALPSKTNVRLCRLQETVAVTNLCRPPSQMTPKTSGAPSTIIICFFILGEFLKRARKQAGLNRRLQHS